jgi:predicted metalloprotease with PDZ domain
MSSNMSRAFALSAFVFTPAAFAANSRPQPVPIIDTIPAARDVPYPGTIHLDVTATDLDRGVIEVREAIPATPGPLVLLLPKWLPGNHGPSGPIDKLAGFAFSANGKPLAWVRDKVDVTAFHLDVPAGATRVEARFQYLSPTAGDQGRIVVTREMSNIQWNAVSLYPAGYFVRDIPVVASLTLPAGWKAATALRPTASTSGSATANRITFGEVSYDTLIDSPVFAGKYFRADDLGHGITLNTVADAPKELVIPADVLAKHRALADQAVKLFGARHFDHYDFLHAVTDRMGGIGLEHHRSSENQNDPGYFIDWEASLNGHNLLPHEFTHSWDGKFRRGADLWTPDYRTPMRDSLLWVYEGQTQFWGYVLEARSGLSTKQQVLDKLALIAANLDNLPGREWRPLVDTTNDPIISSRRPQPWSSYQRAEDYYNEGLLIWTEADAILREKSGGTRSMDDFAHAFFGINDGDWGEVTYTVDDVARTLNEIQPYDWAGFLKARVYDVNSHAPLAGFARSGYRLDYTATPTPAAKANFKARKVADFSYSLGFQVAKEAKLAGVRWGSPAFQAGLVNGAQIVAVNGHAYSDEAMTEAVTEAKGGGAPISLIVKRGDEVRTFALPYHGGLRYPRFTKVGTADGPLDKLLAPR